MTKNAGGKASVWKREMTAKDVVDNCRRETFDLFSPAMQRAVSVRVVLPPEYDKNPQKKYPVLYTMHGYGAPFTTFSEMSPLRQKLADMPMIVVCFDGGKGSFYADAANDGVVPKGIIFRTPKQGKEQSDEDFQQAMAVYESLPETVISLYTTFFFEELVPAVDDYYRTDPERRAATGFSMGGFGAVHYMLEKPGYFNSVSGLSSAFYDEAALDERRERWGPTLKALYGDYEADQSVLAPMLMMDRLREACASGTLFPPLYQHCGTEDKLLAGNRKMARVAGELGLEFELKESKGGHNWPFWKAASAGITEFHWNHFYQNNK